MTPEQRARLALASDKLAEVVIRDVDPDNWAGSDLTLEEMSRDARGDAAWCRKVAVQSVALLCRVEQLLGAEGGGHPSDPDPEADIKRAEKAATAALKRVIGETEC